MTCVKDLRAIKAFGGQRNPGGPSIGQRVRGKNKGQIQFSLAELGVFGSIFLVPIFIGGRHPWGHFVLVVCSLVAAIGWAFRAHRDKCVKVVRSNAEWILVAGAILLGLQVLPLPSEVLRFLSPRSQEILVLWQGELGEGFFGRWSCVSLTPAETLYSICFFVAYVIIFWVTIQILQDREDVCRMLRWIAVAGLVVAVTGFIQYFSGTDKFLGIYEHPFRRASQHLTGSFSTKNHFGHYLALSVGPLLFLVASGGGTSRARRDHPILRQVKGWSLARVFWGIALAIVIAAILGSLSRGAVLAGATGVIFFLLNAFRVRNLPFSWVLAALLACAVAVSVVWWSEHVKVRERLASLMSGRLEELDPRGARRLIWSTVLAAIPDFAPLGSGVGSLREIYPSYLPRYDIPRYFTHAESGYLQIALEVGFPGLVLLGLGIVSVGAWVLRGLLAHGDRDVVLASGAVGASLLASLLQSSFDFVWYVPGCMTVTTVLIACACRLSHFPERKQIVESLGSRSPQDFVQSPVRTWSRLWAVCFVGFVVLYGISAGIWTLRAALAAPYWDGYLLAERNKGNLHGEKEDAVVVGEPGIFEDRGYGVPKAADDGPGEGVSSEDQTVATGASGGNIDQVERKNAQHRSSWDGHLRPKRTRLSVDEGEPDGNSGIESEKRTVRLLEKAVSYFPVQARAHLALATSYLRLFELLQMQSENALPLSQIRDAAISSPFKCEEERWQWLERVLGARMIYLQEAKSHALAALKLCPLLGEAYLVLASLDFLWHGKGPSADVLVEQALKVRPRDGVVLFHAGQLALVRGDFDKGILLWQKAFQCGTVYQRRILRLLIGRIDSTSPADELRFFLATFDPELPALEFLHDQFEGKLQEEDIKPLRERMAQAAVRDAEKLPLAEAAERWLLAARMYAKIGAQDLRLWAAEKAFECDPTSYRARYFLAEALVAAGNYSEAEKHYQWCLYRNPGNETLERRLRWLRQRQWEQSAQKAREV